MINASNSSRLNPIPGTLEQRGGDVGRPRAREGDAGPRESESVASSSMTLIVETITRRVNGPPQRGYGACKSSYSRYL